MEKMNCPTKFSPEPKSVSAQVIELIKADLGFGNLIDLFSEWEKTCDLFWERADVLIFEKGALAGSDLEIGDFFSKTSTELLESLIDSLHARYENQVSVNLTEEQTNDLDNFYLDLFDNLFHLKVQNNLTEARIMHQRMVMNGFPLSCGDAYYEWPYSESEKEGEKIFYEETLGIKLTYDENNFDNG
jgi:hypothetical protein